MRNDREIEPTETDHNEQSTHLKSARNSFKRGRGGREQGRAKKYKSGGSRRKARGNENEIMNQGLGPVGRRTQGQGSGRGRRTVRKRRMKNRAVEGTLMGHMTDVRSSPDSGGESPRNLAGEWDDENINMIHMKGDEQGDRYEQAEALESDDDDQAVGYEQGNWEIGFDGTSSGWNGGLREPSDEDMDASEDDNNGIEEVREEDSEGDVDMSDGSDEVPNRIINDDGSDSASDDDDYSD